MSSEVRSTRGRFWASGWLTPKDTTMAIPGAPAALKGYRLQHLYILHRLLQDPAARDIAFQLEGSEDLDLVDPHTGVIVESVQIKAYEGRPITASDLFSKDDSFFHRAERRLSGHPNSIQKVVGFGPFGQTIQGAVTGSTQELDATLKYLQTKGFSADISRGLIASMRLETVAEPTLERETLDALGLTLAGADPQTTFLFLSGWMVRASEQRERITRDTLHARLQAIGNLANESAFEHLNWGSIIRPIVDEEEGNSTKNPAELRQEFFQGTYTSLAHIQAALDVPRPTALKEIDALLSRSSSVVIHGASGQGKTSLAYRYLLNCARGAWRFEVKHIEDGVHALQLSRVLAKHARAVGVRLLVYIDVPPLSTAWRIVIRDLSTVGNVKVLVTLREDDWNRAKSDGMQFEVADLHLNFSESEAQDVYSAIARTNQVSRWIDFSDVWSYFGGRGPLMEFTYLLTQSESLHNRLTTQIRFLREQVRQGKISTTEVELLRWVAVASAFGARIDLRRVGSALSLPDPGQTVAMFEREYLLRVDEKGRYLCGLHPIRSTIIAHILTDEGAGPGWAETARDCLPSMEEADVEGFLIAALLERPTLAPSLFQRLSDFEPRSWRVCAGILRALLVKGVQEYTAEHAQTLAEAQSRFGGGWLLIVPFDLTGIRSEIEWPSSTLFHTDDVKRLSARFGDSRSVTSHVKNWLGSRRFVDLPNAASELESVSEIVFWVSQLGLPDIDPGLDDIAGCVDSLSLTSLVDFLCCSSRMQLARADTLHNVAVERFRHEYRVLAIGQLDGSIRCHYIYSLDELRRGLADGNNVVMARVNALRCLSPGSERYGATGYGHAIAGTLPCDPAYKDGVPRSALPPRRLVQVNSAFMALTERVLPKESWQSYTESVISLRREVLAALNMLCRFVSTYFRTKQAQSPQDLGFDVEQWLGVSMSLKTELRMPQLGIPLGTPPTLAELAERRGRASVLNGYDTSIRKYFQSLQNFFTQALASIFANIYTGRTVPRPTDAVVAAS
ncbi:MAG: hypothetical protein K1X67_14860 [Fimbriimonadaceae bacterium]|nr:hypothetical protein [Fimbriimonadaceae bacterium]